jgi:hypothetical protein
MKTRAAARVKYRIGRLSAFTAALALAACAALAQDAGLPQIRTVGHLTVKEAAYGVSGPAPTYRMGLGIAVMSGAGWRAAEVLEAAKRAGVILAQCAIGTSIELFEFEGPKRYRSLFTPVSRELARRLALPKPTLFFVGDTRNQPAFDAEAVGRANSRTRPEMADTVWIVSGARDLPVVIAHELAHVLADSGNHSDESGNLMRAETSGDGTRLTPAQCEAIVATGSANGLLKPLL